MSTKAKALQNLYRQHKITINGLIKAVQDGVITPDEFEEITKQPYPA